MMGKQLLGLLAALAVNLLLAGVSTATDTHTINVALVPGDTLYIRFKLDNPSQLPGNFNMVETDFTYTAATPSATTKTDVYNDSDVSVGTFNSTANFSHTGIGPEFIDPTLANPVSNFCCGRTSANLSSYLDSNGMVSLLYQAGPGVTVGTFRALFGNADDGGSSSPILDTTILVSKNSVPPAFVPEPAASAIAFVALAGLLNVRRRRRRDAA